ncbi:MAG TPA: hypothetical protein VFJ06_12870, partial [Halococcus sp.]|nr:hypothetical protein [Halococcus sp.]
DEFEDTVSVLVGVAEVVYPSAIDGISAFVETYSLGRIENRTEYRDGAVETTAAIDENARFWYDTKYTSLDRRASPVLRGQRTVVCALHLVCGRATRRNREPDWLVFIPAIT